MIRYIFSFFLILSAFVFSCNPNSPSREKPVTDSTISGATSGYVVNMDSNVYKMIDAVTKCCGQNMKRADSLQKLLDACRKRPTTIDHVDVLNQN